MSNMIEFLQIQVFLKTFEVLEKSTSKDFFTD